MSEVFVPQPVISNCMGFVGAHKFSVFPGPEIPPEGFVAFRTIYLTVFEHPLSPIAVMSKL